MNKIIADIVQFIDGPGGGNGGGPEDRLKNNMQVLAHRIDLANQVLNEGLQGRDRTRFQQFEPRLSELVTRANRIDINAPEDAEKMIAEIYQAAENLIAEMQGVGAVTD